ncbi:MAG: PcfB family protein [Ruminococcus sp.]|nr:PcfB family protein [Ruminococcus sp.]
MPTDFERGTKKTIDISVKTERITSDILKLAMQEFLNGKAEKKGKMSFSQLENKSNGKLDSIEVNNSNIGDFLNTARKYDVDFALKKDKSTNPPTYHVFFSAGRSDNFQKAFSEYADKVQNKIVNRGEISREQLKKQARKIESKPRRQQKQREKSKENMR